METKGEFIMSNQDNRIAMVPIVPQPYLHLIDGVSYHMALAHLVNKPGMEAYTKFYASTTDYVILDNGVIENDQVTIEELVKKAHIIAADEIILPDVYKDAKATYEKVAESIAWLNKNEHDNFKIHVVPQGSNMEEWLQCAHQLINRFGMEIDTIGIPKHLIDTCNNRDARLLAIAALTEMVPYLSQYDIHLLGCWKTPLEVLTIAKASAQGNIPRVRSCDSAIAYVYARKGLKFSDDDRPDSDPIDFENGLIEDEMLLNYNLAAWDDIGDSSADKAIRFL